MCISIANAITLEEAINLAIKVSEEARIFKENAQRIRAEGRQATAFLKPQLNSNASYLEMRNNKEDDPYQYEYIPKREIVFGANISQVLFAGGRIWNSLSLKKQLYKQADFEEILGKRNLILKIRNTFDNVLYKRALLEILKDRLQQRQTELEDAQDLRNAGMVTSLDVRQANLSQLSSREEYNEGGASYSEALINFNKIIGRSVNGDLLIPEGKLDDAPDLEKLLDKLKKALEKEELVDIKFLKTQLESSNTSYKITKGEHFPELSALASIESTGEQLDEGDCYWNVGLQMQFLLYGGGLVSAKKASALAELKKAKENLRKVKKDLSSDIETIEINLKSLEIRISLQEEAVKLSKENYEDARGQYRAGTITMTRLGEFNLSYAETRFGLMYLFFLQRNLLASIESLLAP